jgi:hypothetical protein
VFHGNVKIVNQVLTTVKDVDTQYPREYLKHVDVLKDISMTEPTISAKHALYFVHLVPI